ncbi:MAG: sigma-E factor negative regulatory protein [Gammaproteobacteria bacterium]|nr:sigma-E factor negative regulatory protein [Gammaproteobacteria bacterium]
MSELDEKLSVVLDQYSDDEHSEAVLNELLDDVNLQYKMRRYQMIGEVMRHELPDQINPDLTHRIMSQIRQIEPEQSSAAITKTSAQGFTLPWALLKPFAGIAVAVSVAVVSISLWQTLPVNPQPGDDGEQLVSVEQQKIKVLASQPMQGNPVTVSSNLGGGTRWIVKQDTPALQQKLNGYLVNHTEYSNSMQGLIPQARVAGYDAEQQ